jgi:hypothetical protein
MQRARKLLALSWRAKLMLAEAALMTSLASLALLLLPFRRLAPWLGRHMEVSPESQSAAEQQTVQHVRSAIRVASRHLPWQPQCLAQAIAGTTMLRIRHIDGTVYLGLAKDGDREIAAHAWLRSGSTIVTGAQGSSGHSVVSTFAFRAK